MVTEAFCQPSELLPIERRYPALIFDIILIVRTGTLLASWLPDENRRGEAGRIGHRLLQTGKLNIVTL